MSKRLKQQYADGKLSEDELEQRLDRELGGPSVDDLDRELRRERE
jgi:phage tail tape-measure protein